MFLLCFTLLQQLNVYVQSMHLSLYCLSILGHKKMPPVLDGQYRGFNVSMGL